MTLSQKKNFFQHSNRSDSPQSSRENREDSPKKYNFSMRNNLHIFQLSFADNIGKN